MFDSYPLDECSFNIAIQNVIQEDSFEIIGVGLKKEQGSCYTVEVGGEVFPYCKSAGDSIYKSICDYIIQLS